MLLGLEGEKLQCTTTCGPDDTYRIRLRETTGSIPRFNNAGSQVTVLLLHNTGGEPLAGTLHFWSPAGALLHAQAFAVPARGSFSFGTAGIAALQGKSGAVTVSHDGAHGQLAGKSVALEAATGFSFDSPLEVRP